MSAAFQPQLVVWGAPDPVEMISFMIFLLCLSPLWEDGAYSFFSFFCVVSQLQQRDEGCFSAKPLPGQIKETH